MNRKIAILALLALAAGLLLLAMPSTGLALPAYATATGQPCSACHVNPAGGGPRNALGQAFEAIATHATDPAGAFAQVSKPAPAATTAPAATPAPAATKPAAAATPAPVATAAAAPTTAQPVATASSAALPKTGEPSLPVLPIALLAGLAFLAGLALRRTSRA